MPKTYRDKKLTVNITEDEQEKFRKVAESKHTDLSELVRQLLHREYEAIPEAQKVA